MSFDVSGFYRLVVILAGDVKDWIIGNPSKVLRVMASFSDGSFSMRKIDEISGDESLRRAFSHSLGAYVEEETGLVLDKVEPFSDSSLAGAIQQRTGLALRTLKDKAMVKEDVAYFAGAQIEARTGVKITDLTNRAATLRDIGRHGSGLISQATGVPLTDIMNKDTTKTELQAWGKLAAVRHFGSSDDNLKQAFDAAGVDVEAIISAAEKKAGIDPNTGRSVVGGLLKASDVRAAIYNRLLKTQVLETQKVFAEGSREGRRREQMRMATKKFRDEHGHRMKYEPVGSGWLPTGWGG